MEKLSCTDVSESERLRRQAAIDYARASVVLEGFKLSELDEAHAQAFVNGVLTLDELIDRGKSKREDESRASPQPAGRATNGRGGWAKPSPLTHPEVASLATGEEQGEAAGPAPAARPARIGRGMQPKGLPAQGAVKLLRN